MIKRKDMTDPLAIRRKGLRLMGLGDDEIHEQCKRDPPTDFDEELAEFVAVLKVKKLNHGTDGERPPRET